MPATMYQQVADHRSGVRTRSMALQRNGLEGRGHARFVVVLRATCVRVTRARAHSRTRCARVCCVHAYRACKMDTICEERDSGKRRVAPHLFHARFMRENERRESRKPTARYRQLHGAYEEPVFPL